MQTIVNEAKCFRVKIKSILKKYKISLKLKSQRVDKFYNEIALQEYHNGISIKEISNRHNVSTNCIRTFLKISFKSKYTF